MYYDYNYGYSTTPDMDALYAGIFIVMMLVALAVSVFMIIVNWKLFQKAGKPGWAAIVPGYNLWVLAEITWGNGLWCLMYLASFIPLIGGIALTAFMIVTYVKLAKAFGQGGGFAVGLIFVNIIFMPILAFGKYQYVGVPSNGSGNNNMNNGGNYNNNQFNNNYQNNNQYNMNNNMNVNNNYVNNNQNNGMTNTNNTVNNNSASFCTNCGSKLENDAIFCTNCGTKVR